MAAIMPATSGGNQTANPYQQYDEPVVDDDLIDPDDGTSANTVIHANRANASN